MRCEELVAYLSDYIDNNLDEALRADAEAHLATCHNCHVVLDTTQKTILLYRRTNQAGIPVAQRDALFQRLQAVLDKRTD
jgi:heterodisulfide reductase subunit B